MIKQIGLPLRGRPILLITRMISNGNRTEWSPIRSVIIRVSNNHNFNTIYDILSSFFNQNTRNSEIFFASSEKKPFKRVRDGAYFPITNA